MQSKHNSQFADDDRESIRSSHHSMAASRKSGQGFAPPSTSGRGNGNGNDSDRDDMDEDPGQRHPATAQRDHSYTRGGEELPRFAPPAYEYNYHQRTAAQPYDGGNQPRALRGQIANNASQFILRDRDPAPRFNNTAFP